MLLMQIISNSTTSARSVPDREVTLLNHHISDDAFLFLSNKATTIRSEIDLKLLVVY